MSKIKICWVLPMVFLSLAGSTQNLIDPALGMEFDSIKLRQCDELREVVNKFEESFDLGYLGGIVLYTRFDVDTLNKSELNYPGFEIEKDLEFKNCMNMEWASATIQNGIIKIDIGSPFGNLFILHEINQGLVSSQFMEQYKYDAFVKLNETDTLRKDLTVPIEVKKILLSTDAFEAMQVIYGTCEFVSQPYFVMDPMLGQLLLIKRSYKYVFKVRIR